MSSTHLPEDARSIRGQYGRETVEFARLVNLSDAVFAIAMTLLVLGLAVPDVRTDQLAGELARTLPQLAAFVLGFALIGNVWWQHHKLFARLARLDRRLVALNLAFLGAVAMAPFPTGLLGSYPTSRATVIPFIGIFLLLGSLFLAMVCHAQRRAAWAQPMPAAIYPWVLAGWLGSLALLIVALAVAFAAPVLALAVLVLSSAPEAVVARRAPAGYRHWS